ncbi:hypothetical protein ES708_05876 [subsurface metagenome]
MKALKPISLFTAQSKSPVIIAPDCESIAMFPFFGVRLAKEKFPFVIRPKQFGPKIRILYFIPSSWIFNSRILPSPPTSLKPAVIITNVFTFFLPHSSTTGKQNLLGMHIIAKSISSGTSLTDL